MNRKFKHKKTGDIAEQVESYSYFIQNDQTEIPKQFIEDSCDWEEIKEVERGYVILEFSDGINIYKRAFDGTYYTSNYPLWYTEEQLLKRENITITSVKRLSDGEVFSVGDKIKGYSTDEHPFMITEMRIGRYSLCDELNSDIILVGGYTRSSYLINFGCSVVKPLFTTEDGVKIYHGDKWYGIQYDFRIFCWNPNTHIIVPVSEKRFSTHELAEEYVLLNKPFLSINDIFNIFPLCDKEYVFKNEIVSKEKLKVATNNIQSINCKTIGRVNSNITGLVSGGLMNTSSNSIIIGS